MAQNWWFPFYVYIPISPNCHVNFLEKKNHTDVSPPSPKSPSPTPTHPPSKHFVHSRYSENTHLIRETFTFWIVPFKFSNPISIQWMPCGLGLRNSTARTGLPDGVLQPRLFLAERPSSPLKLPLHITSASNTLLLHYPFSHLLRRPSLSLRQSCRRECFLRSDALTI